MNKGVMAGVAVLAIVFTSAYSCQFPTQYSKAKTETGIVSSAHGAKGGKIRITVRLSSGKLIGTFISKKERRACPNGAEWPTCLDGAK